MYVKADPHEMIRYLVGRMEELTDWEENFVDSMVYWLRVRKKEPTTNQILIMTSIYNRLRPRL
jgi:hypothetical protein